jgi:copper transport protein
MAAPAPSSAHGYLIRTLPADGTLLERAPTRIQAWFSEPLEARFSTLTVSDSRNQPVDLPEVGLSAVNRAQLVARLPPGLPDGAYIVRLRGAFASDGHVLTDSFVFWVGERTGDTLGREDIRGPILLEVAWRSVQLPALNILFGVLLLYQAVLLPGWGNPAHPAGGLPPRVMRRLATLIWAGLTLAFASTLTAVVQVSMTLFSADLGAVVRDGLWSVMLTTTQIGDLLRWRLILIVLAAGIHAGAGYLVHRAPIFVGSLWMVNLFVAAALLGTLSATSHAAGATLWPLAAVLVDWLHFAATSAWVGGLVGLSLVLPAALGPLDPRQQPRALQAVLRRFSPLAVVAVALLIATGVFSAAVQVPPPADVPTSAYGLTLAFKLLLVAPILVLGLYHQRMVRAAHHPEAQPVTRRRHGRDLSPVGTVRLEAAIGLPVLVAAAVLSSTPPPVPERVGTLPTTVSRATEVGSLRVQLSLDPGAVGPNVYEVTLTEGGRPVDGASVWLRLTYPSLDRRTRWLPLDEVSGGLYGSAGAELSRAGVWAALIDVVGADGTARRAALAWDIPATPAISGLRQPTPLNWLSGAAILIILGVWLLPLAWQRVRSLPLQREGVIIGLATAVATLILFVVGTWMLTETFARNERLRNPTPRIINPALADADSVERGRAGFGEHCAACHTLDQRIVFQRRVNDLSDERLFDALRDPAHADPLSAVKDAARWDVINYLRSVAFATPEP